MPGIMLTTVSGRLAGTPRVSSTNTLANEFRVKGEGLTVRVRG